MMNQEENNKEMSSVGHKVRKTKTQSTQFLISALLYLWISAEFEIWITQPQIKAKNWAHHMDHM